MIYIYIIYGFIKLIQAQSLIRDNRTNILYRIDGLDKYFLRNYAIIRYVSSLNLSVSKKSI